MAFCSKNSYKKLLAMICWFNKNSQVHRDIVKSEIANQIPIFSVMNHQQLDLLDFRKWDLFKTIFSFVFAAERKETH